MSNKKKVSVKTMTTVGLLAAISIVLGMTPLGFIQLPMIKATIMHIPVIIGAILAGPVAGAIIGLIFGLTSMMQNIIVPTSILSPAFMNPLVSVLPRILIGITAYYSYAAVKKWNHPVAIGVGAVVGTITNTAGVFAMIFLCARDLFPKVGHTTNVILGTLGGIFSVQGALEMLAAVVITLPVVLALQKVWKRN